jgi:hypothetical protein
MGGEVYYKMSAVWLLVMGLVALLQVQGQPVLVVWSTDMLDDAGKATVLTNGQLNGIYNDSVYNNAANCRNGDLLIINNSKGSVLTLLHANFPLFDPTNAYVRQSPNARPAPSLSYNSTAINVTFNCPAYP